MRYRVLGKTGLRVSEIGMGGVQAAGKYGPIVPQGAGAAMLEPQQFKDVHLYQVVPETFALTMARAGAGGINFVDTAPSYGDSEIVLGHYLKEHRDDWLVCTKIGVCGSWGDGRVLSRDDILAQVSTSLERLQLDTLDLVLIHSLDQYGRGKDAMARVLEGGMIDCMRELVQRGWVRFIGTSGQLPELVAAVDSGVFDVVLTYNTFNLLIQDAQRELFQLALANDVGVILGGVFCQGLLAGNPEFALARKGEFFESDDPAYYRTEELLRKLDRLTDFVGGDARELRRLALRFALSEPAVSTVIIGMKTPEEVEDNVAAAECGPLSDTEMAEVMAVVDA